MRGEELDDVDAFMQWVEERHRGEEEYQQAVRGVAENVLDLAREDRDLARHRVLQRLTEPDRTVSFRVVWEDQSGELRINRGYRVQHTNALGPYKGGLRFAPSVGPSVLKFLAFEQTFKNALTGLDLGSGKGGADLAARELGDREMMRFCQSFMTELYRHIGPQTDVPAGDIGVGSREIGYLFGQYKRLENKFSGALTGKAPAYGGSALREEATGYGAVYFLCEMLAASGGELEGRRVAVSGAGNVATHVAGKAAALGARVVSLSNRGGHLRADDGLSGEQIERIASLRAAGEGLDEIAEAVDARWVDGEKPWGEPCDVAVPSAAENEVDESDARSLAEGGCEVVVEAANMPLTADAVRVLREAGVTVAPGKAANGGGVAVSGLEMTQNRLGRSWSAERLDEELRDIMRGIHAQAAEAGDDGEGRVDYVRGADRAGFRRVAAALLALGDH